jgi:hypothetical protein
MSTRRALLVPAVIVFGLANFPFKILNCPAWDVKVVDEGGLPVPGITVRWSYHNYSAEGESHEVDVKSDQNGHAAIAAQALRASLLRRCVLVSLSALGGVHASFGPHASAFAFGDGLEGSDIDPERKILVDWAVQPGHMSSLIVVRPRRR